MYFAMARGAQADARPPADGVGGEGSAGLEMTKWFDTNYHYMVPEVAAGQSFTLTSTKPVDEFREAKALGITPGRSCWDRSRSC